MTDGEREDGRMSVEALLNDLRYVIGEVAEKEWPDVSKTVLAHHDPPVDDALLTSDQAELQKWCRAVFEGLLVADEESTRAAALKVRQYEDSVRSIEPAATD